mgnify:CR=1 FL=1|tara:strand:- start:5736 stop:6404 length:669 start_codon:yes stop_codon:yes gene_type:complete
MNDLITLPDVDGVPIEIVAEAEQMKIEALMSSKGINSVIDGFEATIAAKAQHQLRSLIKGIEESRKQAKAPVLDIGREIDGIAKDYIDEVKDEELRIAKLLGSFQKVERDKKIEAERLARIEENKILEQIVEKALETGQDIQKLDQSAERKITKLRQEVALKHDAVAGVKVRTTIKFEIVDEAELIIGRPDLFSPDPIKIKKALKINKNIFGLKVWEETKSY